MLEGVKLKLAFVRMVQCWVMYLTYMILFLETSWKAYRYYAMQCAMLTMAWEKLIWGRP